MNFKEKFNHVRKAEDGFSMDDILVALVVMFVLLFGIGGFAILNSDTIVGENADTVTPAPEPVNVEPFVFPWAEVFAFGIGAVALAVAVGGIVFGVKTYRKAIAKHQANVSGWEKLEARYDNIISRWTEYEMDIIKMIDYPMLTDMTAPTTIEFHKAFRHARLTAPKNKKYVGEYLNSPFAEAVEALEQAFDVAESTAKRSQWKQYDIEEQKKLSRAKDMLALALDAGATAHERQISYRGAMKLLSGLIDVPPVTLTAIEEKTKLALAA